jgi:hypothetical protein
MSEMTGSHARQPSATVVVSRIVRAGHETDYHAWMVRMLDDAIASPGSLGASVLSPAPSVSQVFHPVHTFRDEEALHAWEQSSWESHRSLVGIACAGPACRSPRRARAASGRLHSYPSLIAVIEIEPRSTPSTSTLSFSSFRRKPAT